VGEFQAGSGSLDSGKREAETTQTSKPRPESEQLFAALQTLAHTLPQKPAEGLAKYFDRIRNASIPYRIVLLLDKVDDKAQLRQLEPLLQVGGALRIISVIDRGDCDRWMEESTRDRSWIERSFEIVKCLPVWDDSIATRLCDYYFSADEEIHQNRLYRDFVDGLDFCCAGSPGSFADTLKRHWESHITIGDQGRASLLLSESTDIMRQYQLWARLGRFLNQQWKTVIGTQLQAVVPQHLAVGEIELRSRLFLHSVLSRVIERGGTGFSSEELHQICKAAEVYAGIELGGDAVPAIRDTLLKRLCHARILVAEETTLPIGAPRERPAG